MRDDRRKWDETGGLEHATGLSLGEMRGSRQLLVSGATVRQRFAEMLVAWPDIVEQESFALSLRRDQVLLVNGPDLPPGFDAEAGLAVTDLSSGLTRLELSGPDARAHLKRGAELRLDVPSRSVMRRVFGIDVILYRFREAERFHIHVPRAMAMAFRQHVLAG